MGIWIDRGFSEQGTSLEGVGNIFDDLHREDALDTHEGRALIILDMSRGLGDVIFRPLCPLLRAEVAPVPLDVLSRP